MPKRRSLSAEDSALFRAAVGGTARLHVDRIQPVSRPVAPVPKQSIAQKHAVLRESLSGSHSSEEMETGDELLFVRPGLQQRLLRRLRRGEFSVRGELDLHGMTVAEAHEQLVAFLRNAQGRGAKCVRIVHGKGRRSRHGRPVLKAKLDHWLRLRDEVLAFSSARPVDGGTGALYVLLKS